MRKGGVLITPLTGHGLVALDNGTRTAATPQLGELTRVEGWWWWGDYSAHT